MTPEEILRIRNALELTQAELAQLLGVHPLTVSKWERGVLRPTSHQVGLLKSFGTAARRRPGIGSSIAGLVVTAGLGYVLYKLLEAAFGDADEDGSAS